MYSALRESSSFPLMFQEAGDLSPGWFKGRAYQMCLSLQAISGVVAYRGRGERQSLEDPARSGVQCWEVSFCFSFGKAVSSFRQRLGVLWFEVILS